MTWPARTWTDGEVPTGAIFNAYLRDPLTNLNTDPGSITGAWVSYARTTGDFTKNANTTLGDVTGLSFSIAASEIWGFNMSVPYQTNASAGIKFGLTFPSGATGKWGILYITGTGHVSDDIANSIGSTAGVPGTGGMAHISGTIVNSTNAGTVQLQAAQNASHASNTVVYTNSHVKAFRIG